MSFRSILGHSIPIHMLKRAIQADKVAHSYLFVGREGIGKKGVALQFAKALNCLTEVAEKGEACDHCISCRKIDDQLHPDLLLLEPEGQTIKVDQVRQMQRDLAYRPYEGRYRVCILTAADRMAPNMSNTLLKVLEEPPLHTVMILLATHPKLLLPTILSRCRIIRFNPLPIPLVKTWLMEQRGFGEEEAYLLASLSEGSPGKALEIHGQIGHLPRRELLERLVGPRNLSWREMEFWSSALPSEREDLLLLLEVVKTLLRDLIIAKTVTGHPQLIHADLASQIKETAMDWTVASLLKRMEVLHQTTIAIRANAHTKLALEAMMLSWAKG